MHILLPLFLALSLVSCATNATQNSSNKEDKADWQSKDCAVCAGRVMYLYSALKVCKTIRVVNQPLYTRHLAHAKTLLGAAFDTWTAERIALIKKSAKQCEGVGLIAKDEPDYFGGTVEATGK